MSGGPLRVDFVPAPHDRRGEVHGGSLIRLRRMLLDAALLEQPADFGRVFTHELFHFAWARLGNRRRRCWEALLAAELEARARGELGWSAEWRKRRLTVSEAVKRSRRWREYACESFCDTAAFLFAGLDGHPEFTLSPRFRGRRRIWFQSLVTRPISL